MRLRKTDSDRTNSPLALVSAEGVSLASQRPSIMMPIVVSLVVVYFSGSLQSVSQITFASIFDSVKRVLLPIPSKARQTITLGRRRVLRPSFSQGGAHSAAALDNR